MAHRIGSSRRFVASYAGPKRVLEYDTDHYVDFTSAQPDLQRSLEEWLLVRSA